MSDPVKAKVMTNVTRAALLVEAEGQPADVAKLFDEVLASVARHFPGAVVQVEAGTESDEARGSVYTTSAAQRAGKASRTAE